MYSLQITSKLLSREFTIDKNQKLVIGRSRRSDIVILDSKISSLHCTIIVDKEGRVFVDDLSSRNGVFINGLKIVKSRFRAKDVLVIGEQTITFCLNKLSLDDVRAIGFSKGKKKKDLTLPNIPVAEEK
jgi:pSer/pThr/pTyr-binding forkhead associated (FHA) protein